MIDVAALIAKVPVNHKQNLNVKNNESKNEFRKIFDRYCSKNDEKHVIKKSSDIDKESKTDNKNIHTTNGINIEKEKYNGTINNETNNCSKKEKTDVELKEKDVMENNAEINELNIPDMILQILSDLINYEEFNASSNNITLDEILNQLNQNKIENTDLQNRIQTLIQVKEPILKDDASEAIYMLKLMFIDDGFNDANMQELIELIESYKKLYFSDKEVEIPMKNNNESVYGIKEVDLSKILKSDNGNEAPTDKFDGIKSENKHASSDTNIEETVKVFNVGNNGVLVGTYAKDKDTENVINIDKEQAIEYFSVAEAEIDNRSDYIPINKDEIFARNQILNKEEVFNKILEYTRVLNNGDVKEIRIRLKPESLGKLTIRLIMENGGITAKFITENYKAKDAIESNFNQLQDTLHEKGVNIQELSVFVGNEGKWQYESQFTTLLSRGKKVAPYGFNMEELEEELDLYNNPYTISESYLDIRV